ncbi:MAG TPA: hypothetical protein VIQ05_07385 [Tardiphaga sp.]
MTSADLHNLFVCAPCRQIVQFFGMPVATLTPVQPRRLSMVDSVRPLPQPLHAVMAAAPAPRHTTSAPRTERQPLRRRA